MTQPVRDTAGVETSLQRPGFEEGDRCWRQSRPIQKMPKHLLQAHKAQKQRESPSEDASKQAGSISIVGLVPTPLHLSFELARPDTRLSL